MQFFLKKNVPPYFLFFGWREEALWFIFKCFPISKSFVPNFGGTNYGLSSKTT